MYAELFQQLGLSNNEARIYETLLREGELPVGAISASSGIHRRNVYDTLNRLLEKGLVFEILESKENRYQAVRPNKLMELIQEKEHVLTSAMPELEKLFATTPPKESVYIYKGVEGWKNNIRDLVRIGQDFYVFGAKGAWNDPRLRPTVEQAIKELAKKNITSHILYERQAEKEIAQNVELFKQGGSKVQYRVIPEKYSTKVSLEVFGDHTVLLTNIGLSQIDAKSSFTVIINQQIADAFRTWFQFMWDASKEPGGS